MQQKTAENMISKDYEFNLSDFALFMSVMKVKEAYEDVLSIILDKSDLQLKEVKAEQVVLNKSGKGILYKSRKRACSLFYLHKRIFSAKIWQCILSANGVKKYRNCHWKTVRVKYF